MTEFINMWKNFANFTDRTTVRGYWMAFLVNLGVAFVVGFIAGLTGLFFISVIYSLAIFVPSLAMMIRRLRDAGKPWVCIFLSLIPCVGFIILIVFLLKPSMPNDGVPVV